MEKKNNGLLIGIIIILVVALLGAVIYIAYDKGIIFNNDTDISDNKVNEETKEDVETEITNILEKESLESFVSLLNSASLALVNSYTEMYKNLTLSENEKIKLTFGSLEAKNKVTDVTIPNNQIKISADNSIVNYLEGQVSVKDVEDEYYLLFNENMKTHGNTIRKCPGYFYDSTNSMYYLYPACGGGSDGSGPVSYISKYTSKGNEAYVYVNIGYIKRQDDDTFNAYTNLDGTNLYKSNITLNPYDRNDIINKTNYNEFSEYKLTFGKREDGSYYYKNIERIK